MLRLDAVRAAAAAAAAEKARLDALHVAATQTAAAQVLEQSSADLLTWRAWACRLLAQVLLSSRQRAGELSSTCQYIRQLLRDSVKFRV